MALGDVVLEASCLKGQICANIIYMFVYVCWGFGCCSCMDLSLFLFDYSEAPPEGTGHNVRGIQGKQMC